MLLPQIPDLTAELWRLVSQIPHGRFSTYGTIARALGDVSASRFVGDILLHHQHDTTCKCHRVVRADGSLGKFVTGDVNQKASTLVDEGVPVSELPNSSDTNFRVDMKSCWDEFQCDAPLNTLAEFQNVTADQIDVAKPLSSPAVDIIGGVDVSFVPNSKLAVAAYVEVDLAKKELVYQKTHRATVPFPYISGYLAFRELPLLLELLEQVRVEKRLAEVVVVDGSGVLHPRRTGVASMLGVIADIATIGVTKKHLVGKVDLEGLSGDKVREIDVDGQLCGHAMLPGSGTSKPIFVSPGHRCDAVSSLFVLQRCRLGRRLPESIYWADRISRQVATTPVST